MVLVQVDWVDWVGLPICCRVRRTSWLRGRGLGEGRDFDPFRCQDFLFLVRDRRLAALAL
jgi:hypothetical protein